MTKAEKSMMDATMKDLAMEKAMRRSRSVGRDLPPPSNSGVAEGWDFNDCGKGRVEKSCSSSIYHCFGYWKSEHPNSGWSQGARSLYSTEVLANKALRHAMAEQFAETLARIDARIAELEGW